MVATAVIGPKAFMSTLTSGWRFTLPAAFREAKKWEEGTRLLATAAGQILELRDANGTVDASPSTEGSGMSTANHTVECYLGAGGKIIVPAVLRGTLKWVPGKRLRVTEEGDFLTVSPCCGLTRCRSCGSTVDVREILPNVHLCADCWGKYAMGIRQKHAFPAQHRSI